MGQHLLECQFSTSTSTDVIVSNIALMDTVKHYFNFQMMCECGIPSIELTGTLGDWKYIRKKANELTNRFELQWWGKHLLPVLDQFIVACTGKPDVMFWKSVCNLYGASGGWSSYVTGWVQVLFPYIRSGGHLKQNNALGNWKKNYDVQSKEALREKIVVPEKRNRWDSR